ncbi:MAG: hypothetical protein DI535_10120 [Citrobacter freundii]|nr:MAG: hypothetical protein DI535_10120 [Citrobacter freundii]
MSVIRFKDFFGSRTYFLFSGVLAIPVWIATLSYINSLDVADPETVATSITACFFLAVFTGRYVAGLRAAKLKKPPYFFMTALSLLTIGLLSWLFIHAEFPIKHRASLNMLLFLLPFFIIGFCSGVIIKLFRFNTQRQLAEAQKVAAQSKGELQLLQSQLSPHFLFNTLNNLYGLSITQHEKIPPLLLRLSELLRYSVYEAGETYVPLKMEMDYINNYIEFEKIRMGSRLQLTTDIQEVTNQELLIAPMLLIVFVENAFKFAGNTSSTQSFIEIRMAIEGKLLLFRVSNSYSQEKDLRKLPGKNSGMGLANVYKRLELLYPAEHILDIDQQPDRYTITLQLKLRK